MGDEKHACTQQTDTQTDKRKRLSYCRRANATRRTNYANQGQKIGGGGRAFLRCCTPGRVYHAEIRVSRSLCLACGCACSQGQRPTPRSRNGAVTNSHRRRRILPKLVWPCAVETNHLLLAVPAGTKRQIFGAREGMAIALQVHPDKIHFGGESGTFGKHQRNTRSSKRARTIFAPNKRTYLTCMYVLSRSTCGIYHCLPHFLL